MLFRTTAVPLNQAVCFFLQDGQYLIAVDEAERPEISLWDWATGSKGRLAKTKVHNTEISLWDWAKGSKGRLAKTKVKGI